ncbi:MAG: hypothetical protein D6761_05430 [Candidatus Dadabacteria bacterium]|nr:MAG: hypothetical protein D6761_05430 [Candidatus Dadabacteria bacterium]
MRQFRPEKWIANAAALFAVAVLAGCGSGADIAPGRYRVSYEIQSDTCGVDPAEEDVVIDENGELVLVIVGADTENPRTYRGTREGSRIVAGLNLVVEACYEIDADLELRPRGSGFRGVLQSIGFDCRTGASCTVELRLDGRPG